MTVNTLPGIVRIMMVRCCDIQPHAMQTALCGAPVTLAVPAEKVDFFGTPLLKWNGNIVNGSREESSTLEFSTSQQLPEGERLAFVVTVASGRQYLIGTREPKYPLVTFSESTGAPDGEAALRRYKVTHVAQQSVLPCIL